MRYRGLVSSINHPSQYHLIVSTNYPKKSICPLSPVMTITVIMYIAMNRFRIALGSEVIFEDLWRQRESYLDETPGFREFHLLRGSTHEDHTLYASHSVWDSAAAFER